MRWWRSIPQVVLALTVMCVAADTAMIASNRALLAETTWAAHGWPLVTASTLGCSLMGALVPVRSSTWIRSGATPRA